MKTADIGDLRPWGVAPNPTRDQSLDPLSGRCPDPSFDGYSNFLFLNRDGCPKTNVNYATMFRGLAKKYNKCPEEALPKVMTPHTLRHTFCTNLANAGMNPKALQYIMGHSNITMTLNYYAHATFASARAEMERLIAA